VGSAVGNDIRWASEDDAGALPRAGVSQSRFPHDTDHTQTPPAQRGLLL
jgi:hypothetical protein